MTIQKRKVYKLGMVRFIMEKITCKICGKEIEGYSKQHVEFLLLQHNLKHRKEAKREKREKEKEAKQKKKRK